MNHFAHLMASLCEQPGLATQLLEEAVLAVQLDGRELFVHPCGSPADEQGESLEISVGVMPMNWQDPEDEVEALMVLHRLNALSLGAHGWRLTVDEDGMVILRQRVQGQSLDVEELQALMVDGVDRAASVQALLHEQMGAPITADQMLQPADPASASYIRA